MKRVITSEHLHIVRHHASKLWGRVGLYALGITCGLIIVLQMLIPWNNLPLYATIDGVSVGGKSATDAVNNLDDRYKKIPIALYFGNSPKAYRQPLPNDIGLTISSKPQVDAKVYPVWLRLVPISYLWAHLVAPTAAPQYQRDNAKVAAYVEKQLGESCNVAAQNATLQYKDKKLKVVPAIDGGTCKLADVEKQLGGASPRLNNHQVRVAMDERPAAIHDGDAQKTADELMSRTKSVTVQAGSSTVTVPQDTFLSWLDFAAPDSGITASVNSDRSSDYFAKELAPKVSIKPGTSKITTLDFTEISRVDGSSGQALDSRATIDVMNEWVNGVRESIVARVRSVAPTPVYTRTYTPTDEGMSALIAQFAQAHSGSFGVSFAELDGQRRHASYQGTKSFRTASTYKLFVAYGALKRVEAGQWHWTDQINGGRDLTKCLDDMIVKSDNACGETMLAKIGYSTLTNELRAIGLTGSSFMKDVPITTASDLTTFVGALNAEQLLNPSSTNTLISAMKRNVYRQGIPKGASGQTADKVGFLDAFLHDAGIVYGPNGTYALTIMTEGSSWATIAELTKQIETLRVQ